MINRANRNQAAFTLIELVVVLLVIGLAGALSLSRLGVFDYWEEEGLIRRLSETVTFLHHQAVVDQAFYRLEFDFKKNLYQVGVMRPEDDSDLDTEFRSEIGTLSLELATFLNPSVASGQTFIPPPSMPSLHEPVILPSNVYFEDIRTMRGKEFDGKPYILFSPRGFSEFAVIHMRLSNGAPVTILVNPFSGNTEILREYKDFEWTYGRRKKK